MLMHLAEEDEFISKAAEAEIKADGLQCPVEAKNTVKSMAEIRTKLAAGAAGTLLRYKCRERVVPRGCSWNLTLQLS
jgi:hypothetical protein